MIADLETFEDAKGWSLKRCEDQIRANCDFLREHCAQLDVDDLMIFINENRAIRAAMRELLTK